MCVRRAKEFLLVVIILWAVVESALGESRGNILDYGAMGETNTVLAAQRNAQAIQAAASAVMAQNDSKTVVVPAGQVFYLHPVLLSGLQGLTLNVAGELRAHNNISMWPRDDENKSLDVFRFNNCTDFRLTGQGTIDGQGYDWWWWALIGGESGLWEDHRPHMLQFMSCMGVILEYIHLRNSPQFHVQLEDSADLVVRHMSIFVDVDQQKAMLRERDLLRTTVGSTADDRERKVEIPMFPFNTDGIDPGVSGVHIYNVTIENFDDAIAVKPCHTSPDHLYCNCSSNVLVENSTVRFGVGMTIGSVPPHDGVNCIKNVTFRNIVFHEPLKGIYVKTNPGDEGTGIIQNITYENLEIIDPVWWGIYIGPQQQQQPGGHGPGCLTYPLQNCETQPRVPMVDLTVRNVSMSNGINPFAGVIRCNETRPCTGFVFENVRVKEALDTENYIVEFVEGKAVDCAPSPNFLPTPPPANRMTRLRRSQKLFPEEYQTSKMSEP